MSKVENDQDEIREQTAAASGVRGKYYERYMSGSNVVLLAPDVAEVFHESESINIALCETSPSMARRRRSAE